MAYWLLKSEPETWSWEDQLRAGVEVWDGVRNPQAQRHLRSMRRGDLAFFYHTGTERRVVGIVEVVREAYPDPSDPGRVVVEVRAVRPLARPVTLAQIRADPQLQHLLLLRQPRLSVIPVDPVSWSRICAMGGLPPEAPEAYHSRGRTRAS
ncbi:MAG: EVE domain-containing protein [Armatimonadetes bacterium]|nr:EVE domain-containing protein [Armatimonadota bacterium]MDW8152777.1 EVE domain-containing protein [Armatimonadota bacterium]